MGRQSRLSRSRYGKHQDADVSLTWWEKLKEAIKVRDRLMHPRFPSDLDVSPQEVIATITAKAGFDEALHTLIESGEA